MEEVVSNASKSQVEITLEREIADLESLSVSSREMEEVVSNDASKSQVEITLERELADFGRLPPKSQVEITLERELADLKSLPTLWSCMYKVPQTLHDANKEAYTPKLISIGPYHCRSKNLLSMHSLKTSYLQSFLERTGSQLGIYVEMAQGWEEKVRGYYDEECGLNSDELVHMILMDGIFIVEFTFQCYNESNQGSECLYMQASLKDDIIRDLTLVENQLPFFVLNGLGDHSFRPGNNNHGWIFYLTTLFIPHFDLFPTPDPNMSHLSVVSPLRGRNILHLVEFIHLIILMHSCSTLSDTYFGGPKLELSRSATELQEAGVKLGCTTGLIFTDIYFREENGLLQIPRLVVNRNTESLFRNIIAYEQSHRRGNLFRSYVILMDCLINTSQDVQLLVDSGIIKNSLGESEDVCTLFNNLYKMPMMDSNEFRYAELCQRLNKYSRDPWHKWKATWFRWKLILRRDYFSSPWSIFSVIAAFILLSLTIIQTICSIKGVKW